MAAGEPVALVQLRQGDLLLDFKDDFNAMLKHLQQQGYVVLKAAALPGTGRVLDAEALEVDPAAALAGDGHLAQADLFPEPGPEAERADQM